MSSAAFEQLVAQFEQFQSRMQRVDQQFANIGEMQQQLTEMEAVATSADRAVTVVAGPSGSIKAIRLTEHAMRRPAHALAAELMSTLQQAVAEAARRQAGIVEGAIGDGMKLSDQVLETQAQLFGMSKEELRAVRSDETAPAPAPHHPPMPPAPPVSPPMPPAPTVSQTGAPVRQAAPPNRTAPEPQDDFSDQNIMRGNAWNDRSQPPPTAPPKQDGKFLNLYDDEDGR
ncbi:YbaB/EbfC DNA-binding family protein [Lentzea flaviverrucosa]|uniref:YbaB/EbfC DNA-binding family protein n=1 Tax=Lentzea flaviverrucosa TaxID=200379 RepID=A0A1H9X4G3_9PSEU|nr:YbaB/EbfC DNA-binding family protein [Lentzea flaviverrucosa]SES41014.1 YbaB/EbfC DNA-binding family protein [Lentzea flaviverrucosa]